MAETAGASLHAHSLPSWEAGLSFFMVISGFEVAWVLKPRYTASFWALLVDKETPYFDWRNCKILWLFKSYPPCIFENDFSLSSLLIDNSVWSSKLARIYPHNFGTLFSGFHCLLASKNSDAIPVTDTLHIFNFPPSSSSLEIFRFFTLIPSVVKLHNYLFWCVSVFINCI